MNEAGDGVSGPVTRLGLQIPSFTFPGVADADLFEAIAGIATTAEEHGFDSVWVMDHLYQIEMVGPKEDPMLEGYTLLAALAARTRRVSLGTMVTGVTYRNPALLAKIVTTLDVISSGRAILGIGAAWNEQEHAGYGFDFPPVKERMDRLEEALQIIRAMFSEPAPTFEGRHYRVQQVLNNPKPIRGRIPVLIGGGGEKRTLRLVAQYGDACNLFGDPDAVRSQTGRARAPLRRRRPRPGRDHQDRAAHGGRPGGGRRRHRRLPGRRRRRGRGEHAPGRRPRRRGPGGEDAAGRPVLGLTLSGDSTCPRARPVPEQSLS